MNDELDSLDLEVNDKSTVISVSVRKQLKTFGGWCRAIGIIFLFGAIGGFFSILFVVYEAMRSSYGNDAEEVVLGLLISVGATACLLIGINLNRMGKKMRRITDFSDEDFSKALKNGSTGLGITTIVLGIFACFFLFFLIMYSFYLYRRLTGRYF